MIGGLLFMLLGAGAIAFVQVVVSALERQAAPTQGWPTTQGTVDSAGQKKVDLGPPLGEQVQLVAYYHYPHPRTGERVSGSGVIGGRQVGPGDPLTVSWDPQEPTRSVPQVLDEQGRSTVAVVQTFFQLLGGLFVLVGLWTVVSSFV